MNRRLSLSILTFIGGVCIYSLVHVNKLNADSSSSDINYPVNIQSNDDDEESRHLRSLISRMKEITKPSSTLAENSSDNSEGPQSTYIQLKESVSQNQSSDAEEDQETQHIRSLIGRMREITKPSTALANNSSDISDNSFSSETNSGRPYHDQPDYMTVADSGKGGYQERRPPRVTYLRLENGWTMNLDSVWTSHIDGRGVGYPHGYTTLGALFALNNPEYCDIQSFLDVRGHYLDNGKWAANVGVGARWWNECMEKTIGVNVYYDYRRGNTFACKPAVDFNQIGFGVELLGCLYDLRLNAYIPLGTRKESSCPDYTFYPGDFFAAHRHRRKALPGFDAEIETRLRNWYPCSCVDLYGAIGPYYFASSCGKDCGGGKLRLGIDFWQYFNVEARVSYDSMFGRTFQGLVSLTVPFGIEKSEYDCGCECYAPSRIKPVQRQEIIVLSRKHCVWNTNF